MPAASSTDATASKIEAAFDPTIKFDPSSSPVEAVISKVPDVTSVPPEKLLEPPRTKSPLPAWISEPLPLIGAAKVKVFEWSKTR